MDIDNTTNESYAMLCAEILEPTLRSIALSFCVSTSDFYDTVHELTFSKERFLADYAIKSNIRINDEDAVGYDRTIEVDKSSNRLRRLATRLQADNSHDIITEKQLFASPKIYDRRIYEAMVSTYSTVCEMLGDTSFTTLNRSMLIRSLGVEERAGFSFSEFAMYTCLYMAIKKSAVGVLNVPAETFNQKKRLRGRMRLIKNWLFSPKYRASLMETLLFLIARLNEKKYSLLMDKHCRDHWLPEEKRGLKYLDYAQKNYSLDFPNLKWRNQDLFGEALFQRDTPKGPIIESVPLITLHVTQSENSLPDNCISVDTAAQVMHSFRMENMRVQIFQDFFYNMVPIISLMAEGVLPQELPRQSKVDANGITQSLPDVNIQQYIINSEIVDPITRAYVKTVDPRVYTVSTSTYITAARVFDLFNTYLDAVISSVATFLECLPEANISGEQSLLEYLKTL